MENILLPINDAALPVKAISKILGFIGWSPTFVRIFSAH